MTDNFAKLLKQHRVLVLRWLVCRIERPDSEDAAMVNTLKGLGKRKTKGNIKTIRSLWEALTPDIEVLRELPPQELRNQLHMRYKNALPQ